MRVNFNIIFNIVGFKITWISCVMGEVYFGSWLGLVIGLIYLFIYFFYEKNKFLSLKIVIFFSLIGYLFDSIMSYFGLYRIENSSYFLYLPIWFLVLWPAFSTLFVNTFVFLQYKPMLSIIIGALLGPISYYVGVTLGLVNIENYYVTFLPISIFWALLMFIYSKNIIKFKSILQF
tara:strand:+ start:462 stop:989 length:528 start_codon:yes stop_codon:yes gene_type:complete